MQSSSGEDSRNVVPRWRSLGVTTGIELKSENRFPNAPNFTAESFSADLSVWRSENTLASASDILDLAILTGEVALLSEAIGKMKPFEASIRPGLIETIRRVYRPAELGQDTIKKMMDLEQNEHYLRKSVAMYKKRILNAPRDVLSYLELARLYTTMGSYNKSEHNLRIALALAPDDRFVLRAITQFYNVVGDIGQALRPLWRSHSIKYDPWVQSAEIASAGLSKRGSRIASSAMRGVRGAKRLNVECTELALGLATLELEAGAKQSKVFQIVRSAVNQSTENALAQAVWLSEKTGRPFASRFPDVELRDSAHEARALDFAEKSMFVEAAAEASLWLADQPFQSQPAIYLLNISSVQLNDPESVLAVAQRVSRLHHSDWNVLNAALMVFARAKRIDSAIEAVKALEKYADSSVGSIFAAAGWGLIHFADKKIDDGRESYDLAISKARTAKRGDLVINACMFWLREEVECGLIEPKLLRDIIKKIDAALSRIGPENRSFLEGNWSPMKKSILSRLESNIQSSPDSPFETIDALSSHIQRALDQQIILENI